ncbi:hypothetical protein AAC387_Pa08g1787 [Persea americana]
MGGPSVGGGSILIGGDKVAEGDPGFAEPEITTFGREEGSIGLASCSETLPADRAEIGVIGKSARAEVLIRPGRVGKDPELGGERGLWPELGFDGWEGFGGQEAEDLGFWTLVVL